MMNSPVLKSRHLERRFRGHGAGQNFILSAGLGLLAAGALFFAPVARAANTTNATISILVVEQGDQRPIFLDFMSRLRQLLTTNLPSHVVFYRENLDLARFEGTSYRTDLEDWLRNKYHGHKMDAIVASGEMSINFVLKVRPNVWPEVPVIAVGTKGVETELLAGQTNVTGVTVDIDVPGTLKMALQLFPDTRRIAFVSSAESDFPEFHGHDLKTVEDFCTNRFELIKLVGLTMAETKQRLVALPPDTIVFYDDIWKDAAGQFFVPGDALEELSLVSRAPIFSHTESYIGYGMMGGSCIISRKLAPEVASQIAAVVRAGSANSVPVIQSQSSVLTFDARLMQKYGLSEKLIPPGSRVRFHMPTLWEAYHQLVIIIVAALVIQTGLIAALLLQRRRNRESEQRFRSLLDNAPDAVYVQTNKRIVYANQATLRLLRAECPEQLLGRHVLDLVAPEWREIVQERMQRVNTMVEDGPLPTIEEEYLRVDNSRVAVEVSAVPTIFHGDRGALVFVRDITERKQMDAKVRQLSRAVEQSPVSIVITDKDGNIEYVNRKFTEVTGYSFSEAMGKNPRILKSGEQPAELYQQMWECIRDGREWRGELHNRKKNGELFWELCAISPIFNAAGAITHYLAVKEDVTERRQLEEQLRQSQKMEAFGQLAGGIAHDFNNLLTIIQGHVALLQLEESTPDEQAAGLVEIAKASERAANLTRQLLTFSRRQLFQPTPLDLNEVVANTSKMLQRLIGEHIGLETRFAPGGAPIKADRTMMEQILMNLAVNSRDAMPKGGCLVIQTDAVVVSETDAVANPKARPGSFIRLKIIDTGCGMAPETLERIFEPFFTTKEVGKGTGLGLATVFGIVAQHHGWIEVESKLNHGTTFDICLPRLAESEKFQTEFTRAPEVSGGNETILLVEDEAPVRSFARTVLEHKGYHIIEADSGLSALELWQQHRDTIDLLLTDMVMPGGVSGQELAKRLLAEKPALKVIYNSGYTDEILGENSPLRGNPDFMEKPFSPHKLLKQVRDCLDGRVWH
jgi:two-component system cell cycle sensor histidine kinase/response regulator CckA